MPSTSGPTAVGLGAALSTTFGEKRIQHFSYRISFLSLGATAALAFLLLWSSVPETLPNWSTPDKDTLSQSLLRSFQHEFYCTHVCLPASLTRHCRRHWLVQIGDLHMTKAGEQNHLDLAAIVDEINEAFAGSVSFVFLPGHVADDGSRSAYAILRGELDRLEVPWCAIIGDHDVHEKSFANFNEAMSK